MQATEIANFPGKRGATAASYSEHNPRRLVVYVMEKYPNADTAEVCRRVRKELNNAWSHFTDAFIDHTTINCINAIRADETRSRSPSQHGRAEPLESEILPPREYGRTMVSAEARHAGKVAAEHRTAALLERFKKIVLMELETPFGRPLGDLTEAEGAKLCGWQRAVFKGVGKRHLRDVRSEADLQKVWSKYAAK